MRGVRHTTLVAIAMAAIMALLGSVTVSTATAEPAAVSGKKKQQKKTPKLKSAPKVTTPATFTARGSVGDAYVRNATPGIKLMLVNKANGIVAQGVADSYGSKVFYDQKMGSGYRILSKKGKKVAGSKRFAILKLDQNPSAAFYQG
ncbi:MAG: hypothetical protein WBW62_11230, partial [Solirubrobacterales bacterium]